MSGAFPQPEDRRKFFRSLVEGKDPPPAVWKLARLLALDGLTTLAVTTCFDDFLAYGVRQLGREVVHYDHPATAYRLHLGRPEAQIVHVHGIYHHYDFINLDEEIRDRAGEMRDFLVRLFSERSPIVVGYSGWEKDVLMQALRERLEKGPLPYNLYWFCYTVADSEVLPHWLKSHSSARLVLPPEGRTLPADEVFGGLLEGLGLELQIPVAPLPQAMFLCQAEALLVQGRHLEALQILERVDFQALAPTQRATCNALLLALDQQVEPSPDLALSTTRLRAELAQASLDIDTAQRAFWHERLNEALTAQRRLLETLDWSDEAAALRNASASALEDLGSNDASNDCGTHLTERELVRFTSAHELGHELLHREDSVSERPRAEQRRDSTSIQAVPSDLAEAPELERQDRVTALHTHEVHLDQRQIERKPSRIDENLRDLENWRNRRLPSRRRAPAGFDRPQDRPAIAAAA